MDTLFSFLWHDVSCVKRHLNVTADTTQNFPYWLTWKDLEALGRISLAVVWLEGNSWTYVSKLLPSCEIKRCWRWTGHRDDHFYWIFECISRMFLYFNAFTAETIFERFAINDCRTWKCWHCPVDTAGSSGNETFLRRSVTLNRSQMTTKTFGTKRRLIFELNFTR